MRFADILGHERAIELLRRMVASGRLPHALLFHGPAGVGKGAVARALAALLLCERDGEDGCGRCDACVKIAGQAHPDLLVVRRLPRKIQEAGPMSDVPGDGDDDSDLSAFIRIFQIRQLADHAAHAPREGRRRVFLIDPADRMNAESQNALLKTLEEPPGRSMLVLVASRPHLLLPTVRSRCFAVGFAPLPAGELADALAARGMDRDEALARAALSGGRPGRALDLDPDGLRERRDALIDTLAELAHSPAALAELPRMTRQIAGGDQDELLDNLDLFEELVRDALRALDGEAAAGLLHADRSEALADLGRRLGRARAGRLVETTERIKDELRFNLNRTLVAESLLAAVAGGPVE